jgi:hypothetical protein
MTAWKTADRCPMRQTTTDHRVVVHRMPNPEGEVNDVGVATRDLMHRHDLVCGTDVRSGGIVVFILSCCRSGPDPRVSPEKAGSDRTEDGERGDDLECLRIAMCERRKMRGPGGEFALCC